MTITDELLQKVASGQEVLLAEVKRLRDDHLQLSEEFHIHRRDDREDFARVFAQMEANRKDRNEQGARIIEAIVKRMDKQDEIIERTNQRIDENDRTQARAKGAGWVIIGFITFLGTALITVLGVLASHWWPK